MSDLLIQTVGQDSALQFALSGGDDYRLAYTSANCDKGICIGEVVIGDQVLVDGKVMSAKGFQHF